MMGGGYNPAGTRKALLDAACEVMARTGYGGAGVSAIITRAGVTKGALYHHFRGKRGLGEAVIEERIRPAVTIRWIEPLSEAGDPIDAIQGILRDLVAIDGESCRRVGSPLSNLARELSAQDEEFRQRIRAVIADWQGAIAQALRQGQANGTVRENVEPSDVATFIIALSEGAAGLTQVGRDTAALRTCVEGLTHFLEALRPRRGFRG